MNFTKTMQDLRIKIEAAWTNRSLLKEADSLELKITEFDSKIKNLNYSINVIKRETKQKLEAVDNLNDDELERFFSSRYRQYKDTIN